MNVLNPTVDVATSAMTPEPGVGSVCYCLVVMSLSLEAASVYILTHAALVIPTLNKLYDL